MTNKLCLNFGVALLAVTSVYAQESGILANVPFGFLRWHLVASVWRYPLDTAGRRGTAEIGRR